MGGGGGTGRGVAAGRRGSSATLMVGTPPGGARLSFMPRRPLPCGRRDDEPAREVVCLHAVRTYPVVSLAWCGVCVRVRYRRAAAAGVWRGRGQHIRSRTQACAGGSVLRRTPSTCVSLRALLAGHAPPRRRRWPRSCRVSVGGFWLCSGRPDQQIFFVFLGASGLVFLSLASCTIFGTVLKSARQQPEFGLSGLACHAKSKSVEFLCCLALLDPRLEARGTASALALALARGWSPGAARALMSLASIVE